LRINEFIEVQLELGINNEDNRPYTQYEVHLLQDIATSLEHDKVAKAVLEIALDGRELKTD